MWQLHAERAETALARRSEFIDALRAECGTNSFDRFTAELIYTELVGNVIRHSSGPVDVEMRCFDGVAQLQVYDKGEGFEYRPRLPNDNLSETGRGLFLVSKYSDRVHVRSLPRHGTCVTAIFRVVKAA